MLKKGSFGNVGFGEARRRAIEEGHPNSHGALLLIGCAIIHNVHQAIQQ